LDELLNFLAEEARGTTRSDSASILLNDPRGGFAPAASCGLSNDYTRFLQSDFIRFGPSGARLTVEQAKPLAIEDVKTSRLFNRPESAELQRFATREGYSALLSVLLIARGRSLGVLTVYRLVPTQWSRADLELLTLFAQQAASAIEQAQLITAERRQVDALERMVRVLGDQTHEYANRLHALAGLLAVGEPREAERFLSELMAIHHENNASVIQRVHEPMLAGLLVAQMGIGSQRGVTVKLHRQSRVEALPPGLGRPELVTILANLIQNAIEAVVSQRAERRRVSVRLNQSATELKILVRDWGDGMDSAKVDEMFARGVSGKTGHPGIGLALVTDAVAILDGKLDVESKSEGTAFRVRIPLEPAPTS
jgi:signal transduction histidine kinase